MWRCIPLLGAGLFEVFFLCFFHLLSVPVLTCRCRFCCDLSTYGLLYVIRLFVL